VGGWRAERKEEVTRWAQRGFPVNRNIEFQNFPNLDEVQCCPPTSSSILQGLMIGYALILGYFSFSFLSASCTQGINMLRTLPFEHNSSLSCAVLSRGCRLSHGQNT